MVALPATIPTARPASPPIARRAPRSEEHTSELQSLMRIAYAVFCLKKKTTKMRVISTRRKLTHKVNNMNIPIYINCTILSHTKILIYVDEEIMNHARIG